MVQLATRLGAVTIMAALLAACSNSAQSSVVPMGENPPPDLRAPVTHATPSLSQVNAIIDPGLPASEKLLMREALLVAPTSNLAHGAILETQDGKIHASSRALLAFEREQRRLYGSRAFLSDATGGKSQPNTCATRNLGGQNTGEYRRVYSMCTGYTQQIITFASKRCKLTDYRLTTKMLHAVYAGAYNVSGTGGIDAGIDYTRTSASDNGRWQTTMKGMTGSFYPCGLGTYSQPYTITFTLTKVSSQMIQWNLEASVGPTTGMILMFQAPTSVYATNGSNFVFRRLTAIAEPTSQWTNGDWFGFPDNGNNGPNLSEPDIAYTSTTVDGKQLYGGTNPIAVAERNPVQYNDIYDVICGEDSDWSQPANFNDFEGINFHNANTSGTFTPTECHQMEGS
jgi:hypothetical protein